MICTIMLCSLKYYPVPGSQSAGEQKTAEVWERVRGPFFPAQIRTVFHSPSLFRQPFRSSPMTESRTQAIKNIGFIYHTQSLSNSFILGVGVLIGRMRLFKEGLLI